MGKVKIKRKSTLIDMTAMSDVTVLLLTFFMLTSTFVKKETVQVQTPSSVQDAPVPNSNYATILVSPQGEVSLSVVGDGAEASSEYFKAKFKEANNGKEPASADVSKEKNKWVNDSVRIDWITQAVNDYQDISKRDLQLTTADVETLAKYGVIGVPFKDLKKFAALSNTEKDQVFSKFYKMTEDQMAVYNANPDNIHVGIPIDMEKDRKNEYQIWMQALKKVAQSKYPLLNEGLTKGEGLILKADKNTPFATMHPVLDNMQTLKMTRLNFMTALKKPEK